MLARVSKCLISLLRDYSREKTRSGIIHIYVYTCLELVDLVLAVTKLGEVAAKLALVRGAVLVARDGLVKARRTAHEDLDVLLVGRRDDGLEKLLGDETLALRPVLGRLVEDVEGAETVGELVLELLPALPAQRERRLMAGALESAERAIWAVEVVRKPVPE